MSESRRDPVASALPTVSTVIPSESNLDDRTSAYVGEQTVWIDGSLPAIPGYEMLAQIGRGGMGVVCKARQAKLNRIVAIKMLLGSQATRDEMDRFRQETQALAQLQNPNIVQIFEVGEHGGRVFFTMEFCGEGSLAQKLAGTPLRARDAAELVETLARAIEAAHERQIIHRDLKPANILLADGDVAKVADFGLAKRLDVDSHQTQTGAIMGTPSYMAPEQARGETHQAGYAVDIYALGAILYEALTGRPPFKAATIHETILQVIQQDPLSPKTILSSVPRDLETICMKCLEKRPENRYARAVDLAEDLRRFLDGRPISARPASLLDRFLKWIWRHPATAAAWVLLSVSLVLLAWAALESRRALRAEKKNLQSVEERAKLDTKHQQEKVILLHLEEAKRARQSGNWRRVIESLDEAVKHGYRLTPEERLLRGESLMNAGRNTEARAELEALSSALPSADLVALKDLFLANVLWLEDDRKALEIIRRAIPNLKDPAAKSYASGVAAPKIGEAIEHFKAAIRADRLHADARKCLGMSLFVTGDIDEARRVFRESQALFPDEPSFHLGVILAAPRQNFHRGEKPIVSDSQDELLKILAGTDRRETEFYTSMVIALNLMPRLQDQMRSSMGLSRNPLTEQEMKSAEQTVAALTTRIGSAKRDSSSAATIAIRFHPSVKRYFQGWMKIAQTDGEFKPHLKFLWELVEDHPESFLTSLLIGAEWGDWGSDGFTKNPKRGAEYDAKSRKLREACEKAYHGKGLVDVRQELLVYWIYIEAVRGTPNGIVKDADSRKNAGVKIREYLALFGEAPPNHVETFLKASINSGDWQLAREIAEQWGRADPKNALVMKLRARLEHKANVPSSALHWARQALIHLPKDLELRDIEQSSLEALRKLVAPSAPKK